MILLGAIADDLTGATDLASTLRESGMRVVQTIGLPGDHLALPPVDAIVVALKSRSIEPELAVKQSVDAAAWLRSLGAEKLIFKYCSTFDSTDRGNIGPVADALLDALGADLTVHCPASPKNGRTVYQGHLFVGSDLLSESGMRHHPITPMTDSNLPRLLRRQARGDVSLVCHDIVSQGTPAIADAIAAARRAGVRHVVVDALSERHLIDIGLATADLSLVSGSSGIGVGIPDSLARQERFTPSRDPGELRRFVGPSAILAGSCSRATLGQIVYFESLPDAASYKLDVAALLDGSDPVDEVMAWASRRLGPEPVLIYASETPENVQATRLRHGGGAADRIEATLGRIAVELNRRGVTRFVVAGGETSGAVVHALGIEALVIGPSIDPGVPWTYATNAKPLAVALKSGNFGSEDFFAKALAQLP